MIETNFVRHNLICLLATGSHFVRIKVDSYRNERKKKTKRFSHLNLHVTQGSSSQILEVNSSSKQLNENIFPTAGANFSIEVSLFDHLRSLTGVFSFPRFLSGKDAVFSHSILYCIKTMTFSSDHVLVVVY